VNTVYKKVTVVLTVAHLDHDPENFNVSLDRLRDWCQLCHFRYDANHRQAEREKTKGVKQSDTDQHTEVNSTKKIFRYEIEDNSTVTSQDELKYQRVSQQRE